MPKRSYWLSAKEVSIVLGISRSAVYALLRSGDCLTTASAAASESLSPPWRSMFPVTSTDLPTGLEPFRHTLSPRQHILKARAKSLDFFLIIAKGGERPWLHTNPKPINTASAANPSPSSGRSQPFDPMKKPPFARISNSSSTIFS